MKKFSFMPKVLHTVYSAAVFTTIISLFVSGGVVLGLALLGVLGYAVAGLAVASTLSMLISVPNKLLFRWAQAWDPEYKGFVPLVKLAEVAKEQANQAHGFPESVSNGLGDLSDVIHGGPNDKSDWAHSPKDKE